MSHYNEQAHSFQTLAYRGCWIHCHVRGTGEYFRWQGADGIQHPACSLRAARSAITRHLRGLGLLDKPYTHVITVNGVSA